MPGISVALAIDHLGAVPGDSRPGAACNGGNPVALHFHFTGYRRHACAIEDAYIAEDD